MVGPMREMSDVQPLHKSIPASYPNDISMGDGTIPGLIHNKNLSVEGTIRLNMVRMIVNRGCNRFRNVGFLFCVIQRIKRKIMAL